MTSAFDKLMKKAQKTYNNNQYVYTGTIKRNKGSIFPKEKKKFVRRTSEAQQWRNAAAMWRRFEYRQNNPLI